MSYQAGDTYRATLTVRDENGDLTDPASLTLTVRQPDGTTEDHAYVQDSTGEYHADIELTAGMWAGAWATENEDQLEGFQVWVSESPTALVTLATIDELAVLMGGSLTDSQRAKGLMLLELATGLITEAVGLDDEWAATYHPIHRSVRAVCLSVALRGMSPTSTTPGVSSESETLGQYSHTVRYGESSSSNTSDSGGGGLTLTAAEERLVRRAVWGRSSASSMPATSLDHLVELSETGDIAGFPS